MHQIHQQFQDRMVHLAQLTYRSTSTQEIKTATNQLKNQMAHLYPKSFTKLEGIITKKEQYDLLTRQALVNLYRVSAQYLQAIVEGRALTDQEVMANHKQLLHVVEHAFDNQRIDSGLKKPLAVAYINLFCLFNPENYERVITKAKYFFNTKEDQQALDLIQIYHQKSLPFKYKEPFYGPCLHTLLDFILRRLNLLYNSHPYDLEFSKNLQRLLQLFDTIWCSLTFQTFQSQFLAELTNGLFIQVLDRMLGKAFPQDLMVHVFRIIDHLLAGLLRTQLIKHHKQIAHVMYELAQKQFANLLENNSDNRNQPLKIAKINFLISSCDNNIYEPLIQFNPPFPQLYTKLLYPNFKAIEQYIKIHSQNIPEVNNFLQDLSFYMESQCIQVVTNKLIVTLYRSSQSVRTATRIMISSFLFNYLPSLSNGQVKYISNNLQMQKGSFVQEEIGYKIEPKQQLLSVLEMVALLVKELLKDFQFMRSLQTFFCQNSSFFLLQNTQIAFYSLLIYKNYNQDIFGSPKCDNLKLAFSQLLLKGDRPLQQFSLLILKQQLSNKPPFSSMQKMIACIFEAMLVDFNPTFLSIIQSIFEIYPQQIAQLRSTASLIQNIMQKFDSNIAHNMPLHALTSFLSLIRLIFNIKGFQTFFPSILAHIVQRVIGLQNKSSIEGEEYLAVFVKGLRTVGGLPPKTESLLMEFKWEIAGIEIVNLFTEMLSYTKNQQFSNWLFLMLIQQQFTIQTCLLLHSLIFYQIANLNPNHFKPLIEKIYRYRMEHRLTQNYINGKLNIIILMLMKFDLPLLLSYLQQTNWTPLQKQVHQLTQSFCLSKDEPQQIPPFLDQIYHLVYSFEHSYSWQYDIQVFVILQLDLLTNNLQEHHQFRYANVSFVACTKNILRLYQILSNKYGNKDKEEEESDLFPENQYNLEYEEHRRMTQSFHRPDCLKGDYFGMYQRLVQKLKSNQGGRQWMKTILRGVFDHQDFYHLQEALNSTMFGQHQVRKIIKLK